MSIYEYQDSLFELDECYSKSERIADMVLGLGRQAMRFARIERVPRYDEYSRENDAEHSFMLALIATELAESHFPDLDAGLVSRFSTVHDLVELKTGDIATFSINEAGLLMKEIDEKLASRQLMLELPAATAALLHRYETQREPEARFVRLVDKILPAIVDIIGAGRKVMEEDYDVHDLSDLIHGHDELRRRFQTMFPEHELNMLHKVRELLYRMFEAQFKPDQGI